MSAPADRVTDRRVLLALQGLALGLPLLAHDVPWLLWPACLLAVGLLAVTTHERRRRSASPYAPGVAWLGAFVGLALATTVPLPPRLLHLLAPATAELYGRALPGWPDAGGWAPWRSLAVDPYGVWLELLRLSLGLGTFAVVVGYPWQLGESDETPRAYVSGRLTLTLLAAGALLAGRALLEHAAGSGRATGADHVATWLGIVIPVALAYWVALGERVRRRLARAMEIGRGIGVRERRAWAAALIAHQRRLWAPLVAGGALALMILAALVHSADPGIAGLLLGVAVSAAGIAARGRSGHDAASPHRGSGVAALLVFLLVAAGAGGVWHGATAVAFGDALPATRLAVVHDHPLFGTGLGSAPLVLPRRAAGDGDNGYLALATETGMAGVALAILFALTIAQAARRDRRVGSLPTATASAARARRRPSDDTSERPEWYAALAEHDCLRWGFVGGLASILFESLVDPGWRTPVNLLAAMVVAGLLVLTALPRLHGSVQAFRLLPTFLVAAALPPALNALLLVVGAPPLSPRDCLAQAKLHAPEEADAVRLARRALDRSPADQQAHDVLAGALGDTPEAEQLLRAAIAFAPWSTEERDRLALGLFRRGERTLGATELEESVFRAPSLRSHPALDPGSASSPQAILAPVAVDQTARRLAELEPDILDAVEHGLTRALQAAPKSSHTLVDDLATLREARGRWAEAAVVLRAEAEQSADATGLARAARDYLKAGDASAAEQVLLAALRRQPGQGALYRRLAVDVYAARGDFGAAERVLRAGEQNAFDRLPVYQAMTEVLARRDTMPATEVVDPRPSSPHTAADEDPDDAAARDSEDTEEP